MPPPSRCEGQEEKLDDRMLPPLMSLGRAGEAGRGGDGGSAPMPQQCWPELPLRSLLAS